MATRPVFVPLKSGDILVNEVYVEFEWAGGFAPSQKQKNVAALHQAALNSGLSPVLEVSTKSSHPSGVALSAFNLKVCDSLGIPVFLESAYQASKVFSRGGPFADIAYMRPKDAKRDSRLRESGELIEFRWCGNHFGLEPPSVFYDWLYLSAVLESSLDIHSLLEITGFTDIEFNPKRSVSCQARSCALLVALSQRNLLDDVADSPSTLAAVVRKYCSPCVHPDGQSELF